MIGLRPAWKGALLVAALFGVVALRAGHAMSQEPPNPPPIPGTIIFVPRCAPTLEERERRFVAILAEALGTTPEAVEAALDLVAQRLPPSPPPTAGTPAPIAPIFIATAARLSVPPELFMRAFDMALRSAIARAPRPAMECPPCPAGETCNANGAFAVSPFDPQFSAEVAEALGGGFSGAQVQDALRAAERDPVAAHLSPELQARLQALDDERAEQERALAEAFGVGEEELRAALQGTDLPLIIVIRGRRPQRPV